MTIRSVILALGGCLLASTAQATVTFSLQPIPVVLPGSTGNTIEVILTNTGSTITVGGFNFGLSSTSGFVTFTGATTATLAQYIFAGDSLFGPNIDTVTGATLEASDVGVTPVTLAPGTYGLGLVFFNVAANAPAGAVTFSFLGFPSTDLSDGLGAHINFTTIDQTFQIAGVPEPASAALLGAGLALAAALAARRRTALR